MKIVLSFQLFLIFSIIKIIENVLYHLQKTHLQPDILKSTSHPSSTNQPLPSSTKIFSSSLFNPTKTFSSRHSPTQPDILLIHLQPDILLIPSTRHSPHPSSNIPSSTFSSSTSQPSRQDILLQTRHSPHPSSTRHSPHPSSTRHSPHPSSTRHSHQPLKTFKTFSSQPLQPDILYKKIDFL